MSSVDRADYHAGGDHSFSHNSPRPPVPGGETEEVEGSQSPAPGPSYSSWGSALRYNKGGSSPVFTPRRSSLAYNPAAADGGAPLGFEPEGSCCGTSGFLEGSSPPPYLRWARNLKSLLEDSDGVELFRRYLEQEGRSHAETLTFWFACEGLKKQQDPEVVNQLIKAIYRRFFHKTQLSIPEELRKEITRRIKESKEQLEKDVYDGAQEEVERLINETTYPNFLRSEIYLQHVQAMQNGAELSSSSGSSSGGSSGSSGTGPGRVEVGNTGPLPTLHEDAELVTAVGDHGSLPLTKDTLIATQKRRAQELRPKPEAYAGLYLQQHVQHHLSHHAYSSYNPVSRQDSELQSLSSDARTESDTMSLTDSSVDGLSTCRRPSKKQYVRHNKQIKENASMNRDPYTHYTVIPRTQRILKEQVYPMKTNDFAAILIEKLEAVKREQESQEKLDRKLLEGDVSMGCEDIFPMDSVPAAPRTLADAIREKLMIDDDSDQAILDQHVSRVWSDLTPSRSPGLMSPRPRSPEGRKRVTAVGLVSSGKLPITGGSSSQGNVHPSYFTNVHGVPHPYQHCRPYSQRHVRKEKDVFSTFSSDSGNVHDFPEGSEHKHHMPKSKSMPDYQEGQKPDPYGTTSHDMRFRQSRETSRKSSSKKTLTDLTDSGVSVVSDSSPITVPIPPCKDSRVLSWLMESEKQGCSSHTHSERDGISSKHRIRASATSATSPVAVRHNRKATFGGSRSGSLERPCPAQPFVADPCMPPMSLPHTATQLEEARRRLMEEEARPKASRQRFTTSSKIHSSMDPSPLSAQSTLRKSGRGLRTSLPGAVGEATAEYTTVVFSFCEEQFPYRTKIPGRQITLRQFKEYLPKKGSYRYFFKTECDDLDMKVIQEEITEDNEVLPLWEGKVMAQVKPIE